MRKNHLRQFVDNYCHQVHTGSPRLKKHRHYVLHKVIRDLFYLGKVPVKWYAITTEDIQELVRYWKKEKTGTSTIMKYLTILRRFFNDIKHHLSGIDNLSLGVTHNKRATKKEKISNNIEEKLANPITKCLYQLQTHFGLTLSEAMRISPATLQNHTLSLTRDIATNSRDRIIPIRVAEQSSTIKAFQDLCLPEKNLIATYGYAPLRHHYSTELKRIGASPSKSYRPLYAKLIYNELLKSFPSYHAKQIIMREMGVHSRRTLWRYFNE